MKQFKKNRIRNLKTRLRKSREGERQAKEATQGALKDYRELVESVQREINYHTALLPPKVTAHSTSLQYQHQIHLPRLLTKKFEELNPHEEISTAVLHHLDISILQNPENFTYHLQVQFKDDRYGYFVSENMLNRGEGTPELKNLTARIAEEIYFKMMERYRAQPNDNPDDVIYFKSQPRGGSHQRDSFIP